MTTRELCERAAALVGAAARDDWDVWPYVLHKCELGEPFCGLPPAGWASPNDDVRFRGLIDRLIGWRGRGPLLVVSGEDWPQVAGIAIHEASHVLASPDWTFDDPDERPACDELMVMAARVATSTRAGGASKECHGLTWHRAICHLSARVPWERELADLEDWLVAGDAYEWPAWPTIKRAFSAEVWERRNEPIRRILESDPPPEAAALFE